MRISDWSSDVCSSDLATITEMGDGRAAFAERASARSLSGRHIGKTPTGRPRDAPMHFRQRRLVGADQRPLAQARVQRSLDSRKLGVVFFLKCTDGRSEEHTSELQSLMRISYAVFCLKKKQITKN